jgi:serine/threonine-protein kinase
MVTAGTLLGGRYRLDDHIAGGGMGEVWRGTDDVLGRTVAVKILLPALLEDPGFVERFRGEARTMATINHPGVVDVYDYGSDPAAGAYLVMEYVEGDALSRTLGRVGRLTPGRTMALVAQAADALQAAHDKGIVHRDVKPGNLLVRPDGTLVLTDFGIARSAMVSQLTAAGSVLGTASYISPEQAAGAVATPLSDVYALGVVAYQCLAGRRPFEGDNPLEIAMKHVRSMPPPLPADTPPAVRAIVERAMAKEPTARYSSAAALGQVSRRAAAGLAAGGGAGLGPAGAPISVPPIASQTSPGPVGGPNAPTMRAPVSPAPMPRAGAAYPGATARTQPVAPGGYARGTAMPPNGMPPTAMSPTAMSPAGMPPAPPRRPDTGYPPAGSPRATPSSATPPSNGNGRAVFTGVLVGLVALLLIAAGVIAFVLARGKGDNTGATQVDSPTPAATTAAAPPPPTSAPTHAPTTSPANPVIDVRCDQIKGEQYTTVRKKLEDEGLGVVRNDVDAGGKSGVVVDASPCSAQAGDTIMLDVSTGKGGNSGPGSGQTTQPSTDPSQGCRIGAQLPNCSPDPNSTR